MKLTEKNIDYVIERTYKGTPYNYYIVMKAGYMSDNRKYNNIDEKGRSTNEEYKKEWLPKTIQKFIEKHNKKECYENLDEDYQVFMYK